MPKKFDIRFQVVSNRKINSSVCLIILRPENGETLPVILPGQFINLKVDGAGILLRRPISICNFDPSTNEIWLMVKNVGKASAIINKLIPGDKIDGMLPLGNGFRLPDDNKRKLLLIGGGVGTAPLYFLARTLCEKLYDVSFLVGAQTSSDLLFIDELNLLGATYISTDDGSLGSRGLLTCNECLQYDWDALYVCGPLPMMKAVATIARERNIDCQVSLENRMACGIGACLCCVEDTLQGNRCTCIDGPVFNISELKW